MRLDGKVAFITGGAGGIGYSIAIALAEAGADVAIIDLDIAKAQNATKQIQSETGRKVIAYQADVTKETDVQQVVDSIVRDFGKLDIAFCNAGICINTKAEEMSLESWNQVLSVNLTGVFLTAQAAGKIMLQQGGGSIINTASMSGHIVNAPQPQCAYNASKAGVIQLTKSLAVEWAERNVRVNCISPGYINTELNSREYLKSLVNQWKQFTPLHRLGKPEELQAIALYLAGDASSFTTGSDFVIDGAFTCI